MWQAQRRVILACSRLSERGIHPRIVYQPLIETYVPVPPGREAILQDVRPSSLEDFVSEFERLVQEAIAT